MKILPASGIIVGGLLLSSCGPIKGYSGPELPASHVVTISLSNSTTRDVRYSDVDGISFAKRTVQVLQGRHRLRIQFDSLSAPENCGMDRQFDDCPSCRQMREAACRKENADSPVPCDLTWVSEEMHVMCDYVHTEYECSLEIALSSPGAYSISVSDGGDDAMLQGPGVEVPFRCALLGTAVHRERLR